MPKAEWTRRVEETARVLGLDELLERKPSALSGGQPQRVGMPFAGVDVPLPASSPVAGLETRVTLGIRPTDFEHAAAADPELPRITVRPDVVEDLGAENHVIFSINAPPVSAEAVREATE